MTFQSTAGMKHKDMYLHVYNTTKRSIYYDQRGCFPITLSHDNKYLMVAIKLEGKYVDVEPTKSCTACDLTAAYQNIFKWWKSTQVICPNWHVLDNKVPEEFKQAICDNRCKIELAPADMH